MYICSDCSNESIKWEWQCSFCKWWNTLKEFKESKIEEKEKILGEKKELKSIKNIKKDVNLEKIITKSSELNNVLWWWIVPGWVVLLSWEPWIWKSTITLSLANNVKEKIIYVSAEETEYQIWSRAERLWVKNSNIQILWENCIENILETLKSNECKILVIDSISVMHSNNISWVSWSIAQIKYITELLVAYAKTTETAVFIIWHINKEWSLAWPKTLEHMVDSVLYFEWEKYSNLRILRALKNRFWDTSEIAIFKMWNNWLTDLENPWLEFINSKENSIWSSLSITMEWKRPIIIETESLTTYTKFGYPKRSSRWINSNKLDLIIAVLGKYGNIKLESDDVYTNIVWWLKIEEPWVDLSIAISIISSKLNKIIPKDTIFIWEISLTWKIKKPANLEARIKQAEKMGFKKIFIPKIETKTKWDIEIIKINNISEINNLI
jgi:DNA repair protein RadA/Sms